LELRSCSHLKITLYSKLMMNEADWQYLEDREHQLWETAKTRAGNVRRSLYNFSVYVQSQMNNPVRPASADIVLSDMPRFEAVATLAYIINQKLKLRSVANDRYPLIYTRNGANSDPYPLDVIWRGSRHRVQSNYGGGNHAKQVGNIRISTWRGGCWEALRYGNPNITDNEMDFLMMCEIARRKTWDPAERRPDQFSTIPISFCVALRGTLQVQGQYFEVFRSDYRTNIARNLIHGAVQNLSLGVVCAAVTDYYELEHYY
jgi:hypothetical protein